MSYPTVSQVHVNKPLTDISVAFMQSESAFVARRVFPIVPVAKMTDVFWTWEREAFATDSMLKRADATPASTGSLRVNADNNYRCTTYSEAFNIGDQMRANADTELQLDRGVTEMLSQKALLRYERQFVANAMAASVWSTELTGVSSGPSTNQFLQWNDAASNPITDIRNAATLVQLRGGKRPNKLVLSRQVYDVLVEHPDIIDRLDAGQTPGGPALANAQKLATIFDLQEVLVMDAIHNTAGADLAGSYSFVGGKTALLAYVNPAPSILSQTAGYTFAWTAFGDLLGNTDGTFIRKFRQENIAADTVEVNMSFDVKVVSPGCGAYFAAAIA